MRPFRIAMEPGSLDKGNSVRTKNRTSVRSTTGTRQPRCVIACGKRSGSLPLHPEL